MPRRVIAPHIAVIVAGLALASCGGGATVGSGGSLPVGGSGSGGTTTSTPSAGPTATAFGVSPTPKPVASGVASSAPTAAPTPTASAGGSTSTSGSDQPANATTSEQTFGLPCSPEFTTNGGGYSSCNVQWIKHINLNGGESIGAHFVAASHTYFITNFETGLYAFDTTDPANPVLDSDLTLDIGNPTAGLVASAVENEDTPVNTKIAIVSRTANMDAAIVDVSNPKAMKIASTVPGAYGHTENCLDDCRFVYSSYAGSSYTGGHVIDASNPAAPAKLADWSSLDGGITNVHDLTEIHPGLVATASNPVNFLDTTDPANPKYLFSLPKSADEAVPSGGMGPAQQGHVGHSVQWPRQGADRFFLGQNEGIYSGLCNLHPNDGRTLYSYDTTNWQSTHQFALSGAYTLVNGSNDQGANGGVEEVDSHGSPSTATVGTPEGCSAHWFDVNSRFANGGLVAMSSFSFGVRLVNVAATGQIQQIGWFVPSGLSDTVGVHWITDRILYLIDFESGGLDVIQYNGPLPASGPMSLAQRSGATGSRVHR